MGRERGKVPLVAGMVRFINPVGKGWRRVRSRVNMPALQEALNRSVVMRK